MNGLRRFTNCWLQWILCGCVIAVAEGYALAAVEWDRFREEVDTQNFSSYPFYECFLQASERYQVPLLLLLSIAKGESNFDPYAVSTKGAYGVMQILWPGTASDLGFTRKSDLFDPCRNIDAGARYLRWLLDRYDDDIYLALAAYYSGPNRVKRGAVPDYGTDYAHYIYAKLESISPERGAGPRKLAVYTTLVYARVMAFDRYRHAEKFLQYIKSRDPGVPLEIAKNVFNEYVVQIGSSSQEDIIRYKKRVQQITGLTL